MLIKAEKSERASRMDSWMWIQVDQKRGEELLRRKSKKKAAKPIEELLRSY